MDTAPQTELEAFCRFVDAQLRDHEPTLSPEECVELWRAQHPPTAELQRSTRAVKAAIADMKAGDVGRRASEVIEELRKKHGLTGDARSPASTSPEDDVEDRFRALASIWKAETRLQSSITKIATHPACQQIIGMGPAVVPLLLRSLREDPDHWFWALQAITGVDPVPPSHAGHIDEMAEAWLRWGRENGLGC